VALALHCRCVIPAADQQDSSAVGNAQLVAHETDESILSVRGGYAAIHKLIGGAELIGYTVWFFALYVSQIQMGCIFIAWHYASVAIVVCQSVWYGCGIQAAEWLGLLAVDTAKLAHAVGGSIFYCEGWRCGSYQMTLVRAYFTHQIQMWSTHLWTGFLQSRQKNLSISLKSEDA